MPPKRLVFTFRRRARTGRLAAWFALISVLGVPVFGIGATCGAPTIDATRGATTQDRSSAATGVTLIVDSGGASCDGIVLGDGAAPNARVYSSKIRGRLRVWASASDLDPVLRLADADGRALTEDDNSGGGTTAFVSIEVHPAEVVRIRIDAANPLSHGVARLALRELSETEATDAAVRASRDALSAIGKELANATPESIRAKIGKAADDLLATPGAACSESIHDALRAVADVAEARVDDGDTARIHRALTAFFEAGYPPDHLLVQREKVHCAAAVMLAGKSEEALPLVLAAGASLERTRPADDIDLWLARGVTADVYSSLQELERARDLYRSVMDALDSILPSNDIRRVDVRANLAVVLQSLGEHSEARDLQEQALESYKRMLPEDDSYRIAAENNLAAALNALGDRDAALALHRHVLDVRLRTLPADHLEVSISRMNVGLGLCAIGDLEKAEELIEQALAGYRAHHPEDHPDVEQARLNLAYVLNRRSDTKRALALLEKTLELHPEPLERAPLRFWRTQAELMIAREKLGDLRGAKNAGEAAIAIMSRCYASDSPDLIDQQNRVATLLLRLGEPAEARRRVLETARKTQRFLAECASSMPARQAEAVEASWSRLVSNALSLLAEPELGAGERANLECAFALIESARGIGTNVLRCARALGTGAKRDAIERERALVRDASARLARLANDSAAASALEEAVRAKEHAERGMRTALAAAIGAEAAAPDVAAKTVAAVLREDEAAIGYWIYAQKSATANLDAAGEPRLMAMVVRRDGTLARIELGPLATIESACASWRNAIARAAAGKEDAALRESGELVRKLVVDPLREPAGSARRWIVALDGALHLVPLDALPNGGDDGGRVGDRVEIDVRPVLWDLARPRAPSTGEAVLLAAGGIDYDSGAPSKASKSAESPSDAAPSRVGASPRFDALPDTRDEVTAIGDLFRGAHPETSRADVLAGAAASKDELIARAPRSSFVHLATHGFFARSKAARTREDMMLDAPRSASDALTFEGEVRGFAPMTLCGLALAGANTSGARGVITAEELGALDLSRCELGVLSACDTNVGERSAGQGIASFQKALHAAGARSVVTSLWRVPDRATHELMVAFYRNIWIEKLPKAEALWKAKRTLRAERAPLRDWAGWVLSGEPD